jgi:hypothetical protein
MIKIREAGPNCIEWAVDVPRCGGVMYSELNDPREALFSQVILKVVRSGIHQEMVVTQTNEFTDGQDTHEAIHDPERAAELIKDGLHRLRRDGLL